MTTDHSTTYTEIRDLLQTNEAENIKKAQAMLRELAEGGHVDAQTDIGFVLLNASDDPAAQAEAVHWFERAAEAGSEQAAFNLGVLYQTGKGVPVELEKARGNFGRAAKALHPEGAFNYVLLTKQLDAPKEDLVEGVGLLEQVVEKTADANAHYALGLAKTEGWVGEIDLGGAVRHFEIAVAGGHVSAAYNLGVVYYYGNDEVPADREKAKTFLEIAASKGHTRAKEALNDASLQGDKPEESPAQD